jgi:hypothetical protein
MHNALRAASLRTDQQLFGVFDLEGLASHAICVRTWRQFADNFALSFGEACPTLLTQRNENCNKVSRSPGGILWKIALVSEIFISPSFHVERWQRSFDDLSACKQLATWRVTEFFKIRAPCRDTDCHEEDRI